MSVEVSGLSRRYNGAAALDGVSLRIETGEFVALLGPSGSGKTTLLRSLAGLDLPDDGTIRVSGRDMGGVPARSRGVGFVFQHYALFRHMTVFENIAFGLRIRPRRLRPAEADLAARVHRLLDLVQLPGLDGRFPDQLSGGQRQRVALARALAIEPSLLLLDEPFGALDAQVRRDLRRWLHDLHTSLGITSVLVTHDQEEAMELADRVAVLHRGRIVQFDTPGAVLDRPATAFVAGFVGQANRVPCQVRGGQARFDRPELPPVPAALPDGPALAFIRPADLLAQPGGPARVLSVRDDGGGLRLHVLAEGIKDWEAALDAVPQGDWRPQRGDACTLSIRNARLFAAEQG